MKKKILTIGLMGLCFFMNYSTEVHATEYQAEQYQEEVEKESEYTYYKVYDEFYGSNDYHTLDKELQEYMYDLCVEYEIEDYYSLLLCQLFYESLYRSDVISRTDDYGIAQINICNHKWLSETLGVTDFLDPKQGILCNVYLMSESLKNYDAENSLCRYNTGKPGSNQYSQNIMYLWENNIIEVE